MGIDTSVLLAILKGEPEAEALIEALCRPGPHDFAATDLASALM